MATTTKPYTGNGVRGSAGNTLTFPFTYIQTTDVKVSLNGTTLATTKYSFPTATSIQFTTDAIDTNLQETNGAPKQGVDILIYRDTDVEAAKAVFAAGSSIRAFDLNNNQDQILFFEQEVADSNNPKNNVTSANIVDGTIVNADINDSAAIAGTKINPDFGSQALTAGNATLGNIVSLTGNTPRIQFVESDQSNENWYILTDNTNLTFRNDSVGNNPYPITISGTDGTVDFGTNVDCNAGLDVTGNATFQNISGAGVTLTGHLSTTGNITAGNTLTLSGPTPNINLTENDDDPDFQINVYQGKFHIKDTTVPSDRFRIDTAGDILVYRNLNVGQGLNVTGEIAGSSHLDLPDDAKLKLGNSDDFQIFHQSSNSNSIIKESGGGVLSLQTNGTNITLRDTANQVNMALFATGGACQFNHGATTRLATTSTGVNVTGDIAVSGTVDSVDLSTYQADGGSYLRSDADDSFSGTLTGTSDSVNPVLIVKGGGPNIIRFDANDGDNADTIDLIYRTTPNTLAFERRSDAQIMFSVDADDQQAIFNGNVDCNAGLDVTSGDLTVGTGELTVTTGDLTVTEGDLTVTEGYLTVGEDVLFVNSVNGNVGIGTTTPDANLHIKSTGDCILMLQGDSGNQAGYEHNNPFIKFVQDGSVQNSVIGMNPYNVSGESNSLVLANSTGSNGGIIFKTGDTATPAPGYTNAVVRMEIKSDGDVDFAGNIILPDDGQLQLGNTTGGDLKIYHSGSNAYIDNTTGHTYIRDNGYGAIELQPTSGEKAVVANANTSVDLYYDGGTYSTPKLSTTATGIDVNGTINVSQGGGGNPGLKILDNHASSGAPYIEVIGRRDNQNGSACFSGKVHLARYRNETNVVSGNILGVVAFGGNHTDGTLSNILYTASISGVASGHFDANDDMPTDLVFYTGSTGRTTSAANVTAGDERMRIKADGTTVASGTLEFPSTLASYDPTEDGSGSETSTTTPISLMHGHSIAVNRSGYLRNILKIDTEANGSHIEIGRSSTDYIGDIKLLPGSGHKVIANYDGSPKLETTANGISVANGSAVAPSITFDQSNTGLFKGSAGRISFASGGVQIWYADGTSLAVNNGYSFLLKNPGNTAYTAFKAPNSPTTYTLTMPDALPSVAGYALTSDTSGVLSWAEASGGSSATLEFDGTTKVEAKASHVEINESVYVRDTSPQILFQNSDGTTNYASIEGYSSGLKIANEVSGTDTKFGIKYSTSPVNKLLFRPITVHGAFNQLTNNADVCIGHSMTGTGKPDDLNAFFPVEGGVELYWMPNEGASSKKFETTETGIAVTSTDDGASANPILALDRNSSTPADDDVLGDIHFKGRNSAGEEVTYGSFMTRIADASDGSEDGRLIYKTMKAGALTTVLDIKADQLKVNNVSEVFFGDPVDSIKFEGATGDAYETTIQITDPTADRTITVPDTTGTFLVAPSFGIANQVLQTDGSGGLSWVNQSGGSFNGGTITNDLTISKTAPTVLLTSTNNSGPTWQLENDNAAFNIVHSPSNGSDAVKIKVSGTSITAYQNFTCTKVITAYDGIVSNDTITAQEAKMCHLKSDTTASVSTTAAVIDFNQAESTNNNRFTVSNGEITVLDTGFYQIKANVNYQSDADSRRNTIKTEVQKNGTSIQSAEKYTFIQSHVKPIIIGHVNSDGTNIKGEGYTVSRSATGRYTVTFDTAMSDANYIVNGQIIEPNDTRDDVKFHVEDGGQTTNGFDIHIYQGDNGTNADVDTDRDFYFIVNDLSTAWGRYGSATIDTYAYLTANDVIRIRAQQIDEEGSSSILGASSEFIVKAST